MIRDVPCITLDSDLCPAEARERARKGGIFDIFIIASATGIST
jgi:hypothetical protein